MARPLRPEICEKIPKKKFLKEKAEKGRRALDIDQDMVFKLAESMLPVASIAQILDCSVETLYSRFPQTLRKAREGRKKSLSLVMWEKALIDKDTKMMIWLSKQHLGYKDVIPETAANVNFNVYCNEVPK